MAISDFERIDKLPDQHSLIMNELAYRVGCIGCRAPCAGVFQIKSDREARDELVDSLTIAHELTGVPVTAVTGTRIISLRPDTVADTDQYCPNGSAVCYEPSSAELFAGFQKSLALEAQRS